MTVLSPTIHRHKPLLPSRSMTLAHALAWAGHDCLGGCPESAADTPAQVWFLRRPTGLGVPRLGRGSLLVVDLGASSRLTVAAPGMLRAVNSCTVSDHLRVRERLPVDQGHALAVLYERQGSAVGPHGQCAGAGRALRPVVALPRPGGRP
jgi:hypothetical protein